MQWLSRRELHGLLKAHYSKLKVLALCEEKKKKKNILLSFPWQDTATLNEPHKTAKTTIYKLIRVHEQLTFPSLTQLLQVSAFGVH